MRGRVFTLLDLSSNTMWLVSLAGVLGLMLLGRCDFRQAGTVDAELREVDGEG